MHRALQRFSRLQADTTVHCAHEYTEANLRWAAALQPTNEAIQARLKAVQAVRREGGCSLPSTIAIERDTNLMLRSADAEELGRLRQHKDHWNG